MTPNPYLRAAGPGELLGNALRLFRDHLMALVLVALPPHLVPLALELALLRGDSPDPTIVSVFLMTTVVVNGVALAAVTLAVSRAALGEEPAVGETYARTFRVNLVMVVLAYVFNALLVSAGFMVLIFPGLIVGGLFAPLVPIVVLERRSLFSAVGRSLRLVRGELFKVVLVFAYFIAIAGILPFLFLMAQSGPAVGPLTSVLGAIVGAVTLPLGYTANVLLYLSLRSTEGYTVAQLREDARLAEPETP